MKIKCRESCEPKELLDFYFFRRIEFSTTEVLHLFTPDFDKQELLELLNSVNNQGIEDINVSTYSYYRKGKWLGFADLCTAERVFLVSYFADLTKRHIYINGDISLLTRKTLCKFLRYFKDSEYITVVYNFEYETALYEEIWEEVQNG